MSSSSRYLPVMPTYFNYSGSLPAECVWNVYKTDQVKQCPRLHDPSKRKQFNALDGVCFLSSANKSVKYND